MFFDLSEGDLSEGDLSEGDRAADERVLTQLHQKTGATFGEQPASARNPRERPSDRLRAGGRFRRPVRGGRRAL